MASSLPRSFERVVLLRQIARGGMGEVFLGALGGIEGAERPCVVKIIRREHGHDSSFLARFFDEARIQAQLQHHGVAQVLEASTDSSGKPYVVVEYVEGRNLGEIRTRASHLGIRLAWPDAVAIAITIGEALGHVHGRTDADGKPLDIVHRDVSPQNVMVGYGGEVKLIDFGTARGQNRRSHTVAGIVFAKPGYVAPEVANNVPGGVPADLYAFGIMLWELLTGRRFLTGETAVHLEEVAAGRRRPSPVASVVDAPEALDEIIDRLTAVEPSARYSSACEVVTELVDLLKRAPSLADGQRSVRTRIANLMHRLYPAEPARTRAEFARLLSEARAKINALGVGGSQANAEAESSIVPAMEAEANIPNLLPGTRYQLLAEIGRGGMGVVHRAMHVDLGRSVALKILPEASATNAEFGSRFRSEARAIAALSHENLVKLHDYGLARDGRAFYAMELLDGESLDATLERDQAVDWRRAVKLCIQACDALDAAHAEGVVHCDIKPANLFVTRRGTLKLLDFGVARFSRDLECTNPETRKIRIVGTPEYMSPEQANGLLPDARSDIYALGAVLYELCTGLLPHAEANTLLLLAAKQQQPVPPPRARAPQRHLPKALDGVIAAAVELDRKKRYQSAKEFRDALQGLLATHARPSRARQAFASAAVGALIAGALAAGLVVYQRPKVRTELVNVAKSSLAVLKARVVPSEASSRVTALASNEKSRPLSTPSTAAVRDESALVSVGARPQIDADDLLLAPGDDDVDDLAGVDDTEPVGAVRAAKGVPAVSVEGALSESSKLAEGMPDAGGTPTAEYPELDKALDRAQGLLEAGQRVRALSRYRSLAKSHPKDVRVLAGWVRAAEELKGWGEALRVAERWAKLEPAADSWATLARLQRATGHRSQAIHTLELALEREPDSEELREQFARYNPAARVALKDSQR